MLKLKELIPLKALEKLFLPTCSWYEVETFELKDHPIELRKGIVGQTITLEFNKRSLSDLKSYLALSKNIHDYIISLTSVICVVLYYYIYTYIH